jgi:uncharacterized membrane protein YkvA (DUF1232 family)
MSDIINTTELAKYEKHFSTSVLFEKLKKVARKAGLKTIYAVLLLFYTLIDGKVSIKDKSIILGALGYFIFPLDLLPDMMLPVGYVDDLTMLFYAIGKIRSCITPEIKEQAKNKLREYFNVADENIPDICR